MNIEKRMYVRTKYGIKKVETYNYHEKMPKDPYEYNDQHIYKQDILKASFNIIDLIEVGDFVNGYEVTQVYEKALWLKDFSLGRPLTISKDIKEILTHEQYNSNKYVIGDDNNA